MSLLARFEGVAERLFTAPFKKNATRLQPVEIAKELAKAMSRNKQVSVSKVYVPNVYRVFLHPSDWGPLASFGDAFLIELSKFLFAEGERNGFTFLSKPAIELHSDETVNAREMFIEVDFDDSVDMDWGEEDDEFQDDSNWHERTNIFQNSLKTNFPPEPDHGRNSEYYLEIIEGPDKGAIHPLLNGVIHVGRHTQCELVLQDPEVSRRHLRITPVPQGWLLDDLGSTNGTLINNQRITLDTAQPGDRIQVGQTVLVIKRKSL